MRRAFTLPELMLVLAVVAILLGIAVPSLSRAMDQIELDAAAAHVVAAHHRARIMALVRGQVLTLAVDSSRLSISPYAGAAPLWQAAGPGAAGVHLAGSSRQFTFSPEGYTLGLSNASLLLTRGSSTRTIVISRLGRVRVLR
jgi:type IV fimbrial biogenesis protein FimT